MGFGLDGCDQSKNCSNNGHQRPKLVSHLMNTTTFSLVLHFCILYCYMYLFEMTHLLQIPSVYGWWFTCHAATDYQNLCHPSSVQLLSTPQVSQHYTVSDSIPTQHTGWSVVCSYAVLFRCLVPLFRNNVYTFICECTNKTGISLVQCTILSLTLKGQVFVQFISVICFVEFKTHFINKRKLFFSDQIFSIRCFFRWTRLSLLQQKTKSLHSPQLSF